MLPDGNVLGYQGEHNATSLSITPPTEMTECEEIAGYKIAFQLNNCRCCHSELIEKAPSVEILLSSQITSSKEISVQLEGYSADGNLVIKSKKVAKLTFDDSVAGTNVDYNNGEHGTAADIAANTLARHTHDNADILNEFGENEAGKPTYKDEVIGTGNERPTETKIFLNDFSEEPNTDVTFVESGLMLILAVRDKQNDLTGKEIAKIEYSFDSENWIDIRDFIQSEPTATYTINVHRAFQYNDHFNRDTVCWGALGIDNINKNALFLDIQNQLQYGFRVTYYTD